MLITTLSIGILAVALSIIAYTKGVHVSGFNDAYKTGIRVIPIILFAFIVIGMLNNLISKDAIKTIAGEEAGIKGIVLATLAGIITPGGTFVALPMAGTLLKFNAGIGSVVAYITAYSIFDITRLPIEISFLGWKFVLVKWCCVLIVPVIGGLIARQFFSWVNF